MAKKPKRDPEGPFAKLAALRDTVAAKKAMPAADARSRETMRPKAAKPREGAGLGALRDAYAGVKPLSDRERGRVARAPTAEPARIPRTKPTELRDSDLAAHARLASLVAGGVRFDVSRDETGHLRVQRLGDDRNVLRSLVRGLLAVDGELDLHGMKAADAEAAVVRFVRRHARDGARAVRIVHGKGLHSEGGLAVLADVVLHALTEGGAAPVVRAIATPDESDGGTGAVLVALGGPR